ncbi:MAG: hypothetical protein WA919_18090 [Coleofasciculaceae cyanobacterium]
MTTLKTQIKKKKNPKREKRSVQVSLGKPKFSPRQRNAKHKPEKLSDWENAS